MERDRRMVLHWAGREGRKRHLPIVKLLLDAGTDPNVKGDSRATALHWAATAGISR